MEELSERLEEQLSKAVEVKDPQYLHKYVQTLLQTLVEKDMYEKSENRIEREIKELTIEMRNGFSLMDQRFESLQKQIDERFTASDRRFESMQVQMDKRFESMQKQMDARFESIDKRFSDMHRFMSLGFTALAILITAFNIVLILVK